MKPLRLVMSAFGSYLKQTEIDFEALGDGIFLITGDTGAGKTTIFDARLAFAPRRPAAREEAHMHNQSVYRRSGDQGGTGIFRQRRGLPDCEKPLL